MKKGKGSIYPKDIYPKEHEILTNEECKHLKEVCLQSKDALVNYFAVYTMLIAGLRIGEMVHIRKRDFNLQKKFISIPPHIPCCCSYCRVQAMQRLTRAKKPKEEWKNISDEKLMQMYWRPKYNASIRSVYYGYDSDYSELVERFFEKYDQFPFVVVTAREKIKKMYKLAGIKNHIPHDLRKTCGTYFASKSYTEHELMNVMGWETPKVARVYIRLSGTLSVDVGKKKLGDGEKNIIINNSHLVFYITDQGRMFANRKKKSDEEEWLRSILLSDKPLAPTQRKLFENHTPLNLS